MRVSYSGRVLYDYIINLYPFGAQRSMSIIHFPKPANDGGKPVPPLLNIPPLTLGILTAILGVHVLFMVLPQDIQQIWGYRFAFVPGRYAAPETLDLWAAVSPFTHVMLHGSWLHVGMNSLMLLAFGAGAERMLGAWRAALLFVASGIAGAFAQVIFGWGSPIPMIGASGALSGLFAALCLKLQQTGRMQNGRYGIWGVGAMWIGLSLFMAFVGGSIGIGDVAWAAHAGGFIAGALLMRLRYFS